MTTQTLPTAAPQDRTRQPGLGVLLTGTFITTLDFFIVNVAIPATQRDLGAGPAAVQWIVAGFGLALAAALVIGGRLGDLHGRRRLFGIGLGLFTAASLACGLAPNAEVLVAARVGQGLAAALLMPQVLGTISAVCTGRALARAYTAYGLTLGFGGVFGQLIGGALIQVDVAGLGWRSIFLINVPIGLVALAALRRVPESRGTGGTRLDLVGALLATAATVAVVLPLVQGVQRTWLLLAAAPVLAAVFAGQQRRLAGRGGEPLVHPELRARSFSVGATLALVYSLAMASFFLILALYLQQGRGMSALGSGLLFGTLGVGYFLASTRAEAVAARLGRQVLAVGALVQAVGYGLLFAAADDPLVALAPGLLLAGAGMGLVLTPLSGIALAGVARHAASAAGVLATAQQVGGAVGVALVGAVFYDALPADGMAGAFRAGLVPGLAACLVTAALTQAVPRAGR